MVPLIMPAWERGELGACDRKPGGLLDFFLTCSISKKHRGEAHLRLHIHSATPAGCSNSSCAGEGVLMESSPQWEDWWVCWK